MPRSRAKQNFKSLHLNARIYPEALSAVAAMAAAEDRTAANTAAILICEAWDARQRRAKRTAAPSE